MFPNCRDGQPILTLEFDLIELAQSWLLLAEQADKNLAADLVYEPPPPHNEVAGAAVAQHQQQIQPKKED